MKRNIIIAAITAIVIGLGITFQVVATTPHGDGKHEPAATATQSGTTGDREGSTAEHTGKPGESKP